MRANRDFVEIALPEANHNGGFIVGESNIREGIVVSVGSGVEEIEKKDKVLFDTNKALQYPVKGENHYFVKAETILAYENHK